MTKHYAHPELQYLILRCLKEWHAGKPTDSFVSMNPHLSQAIQEQNVIGWWGFLLGRLSKKFALVQDAHLRLHGKKQSGQSWINKLITEVWEVSFAMWEHRNDLLHGDTLTPTQCTELEMLRLQVREEFAKGPDTLLQQDRWRLDLDYREWALEQPIDKTKRWLESLCLSREHFQQIQQQQMNQLAQQQQLMQNWLHQPNEQ